MLKISKNKTMLSSKNSITLIPGKSAGYALDNIEVPPPQSGLDYFLTKINIIQQTST